MLTSLILFQCAGRGGHFGQGTFVNNLIPHFKENNKIELTVILTDDNGISKPIKTTDNKIDKFSIPPLLGNRKLTGESLNEQHFYAIQLAGIIFEYLRQKPNIVVWVNTIDYLNVCFELKKMLPKIKLFYVHHSFSWKYLLNVSDENFKSLWNENKSQPSSKAFEMTEYQRRIALLADRVVTVTQHAKDLFVNVLEVPSEKIQVIYNGSSQPDLKHDRKYFLRKKYGFDQSDYILVICGRVTRDKGVPHALEAFKHLAKKYPTLKIVIIGTGYISEFIHLSAPYWNRVIYTGEVDPPVVSDFYLMADIGLVPSFHEQCSFTAIEMQFYQLPLVISDIDGLSELFIDEYDAIKFPINFDENGFKQIDPKNIAKGIDRLLSDPSLRQLLAINAWKKATKIHSISKMRGEYDRLIEHLSSIEHVHTTA